MKNISSTIDTYRTAELRRQQVLFANITKSCESALQQMQALIDAEEQRVYDYNRNQTEKCSLSDLQDTLSDYKAADTNQKGESYPISRIDVGYCIGDSIATL
jgi:hypothetical protein